MAISTSYIAFLYLVQNRGPTPIPRQHGSDGLSLGCPVPMIEFQDQNIRLSAIDTWMIPQISAQFNCGGFAHLPVSIGRLR